MFGVQGNLRFCWRKMNTLKALGKNSFIINLINVTPRLTLESKLLRIRSYDGIGYLLCSLILFSMFSILIKTLLLFLHTTFLT